MRKIFIEDLPKYIEGIHKGKINWKSSINHEVKFIYNDIQGIVKIINYDGLFLFIKYLDKKLFKIRTTEFRECGIGRLLKKVTNEFKVEIGQIFKDDKRSLTIINREYRINKNITYKYYKYKCNICGWEEGWISESNLLHGYNCSCCTNQTVVPGINDIPTTIPWMVKYFQGGIEEAKLYTKCSSKPIYPICPDCGKIKDKPMMISTIYKQHSIGCTCSDGQSYPNKISYALLNQLNKIYKFDYLEHEYNPEWIKPKRYDNYFEYNDNKYILEMDGGLGHGKIVHSKSTKTIEETQEIDDYKDKLANEHNIKVIRIDCDNSDLDYIKNKILNNNQLNDLFDLSKINWMECEKFALSNLVKIACEYKKNNPNMTTTDIGSILKLDRHTILRYLKKGNKLNWCQYNTKEEKRKSGIKAFKSCQKSVEIFKDNISLGIFESCAELSRQSKKLFGIQLSNSKISKVCINKGKTHKGFTFKYI